MLTKQNKYFVRQCEKLVLDYFSQSSLPLSSSYSRFAVLPLFSEENFKLDIFLKHIHLSNEKWLIILVINAPQTCLEKDISINQQTLKNLHRTFSLCPHPSLSQIYFAQNSLFDLLVIDSFSQTDWRLPNKQAIGLARKIGFDFASAFSFKEGNLENWIHSWDADSILPQNYFTSSHKQNLDLHSPNAFLFKKNSKSIAKIYPFKHLAEGSEHHQKAIRIYDDYLKHYRQILKDAASPYAFISVGSCFAVLASAYIAVQGMPKRDAGEDFYFLNKIAKLGKIELASTDAILLSGRLSQRTAYGSGTSILKIKSSLEDKKNIFFENPLSSKILHTIFDEILNEQDESAFLESDLKEIFFKAKDKFKIIDLCKNEMKKYKNKNEKLNKFFQTWDALETRKFIHLLEEAGFKKIIWK